MGPGHLGEERTTAVAKWQTGRAAEQLPRHLRAAATGIDLQAWRLQTAAHWTTDSSAPYTTIDDTGVYKLGTDSFFDSDNEALGVVNVTAALSESSDVFFYTLGGWFNAENTAKYGQTPIQNVAANAYGIGVWSDVGSTSAARMATPSAGSGPGTSCVCAAPSIAQHAENPDAFPNTTYFSPVTTLEMAFGQGERR